MSTVEWLEGLMLVCFSLSWYWSIAKMLQTQVASGKSLIFVLMICLGYTLGMASKMAEFANTGQMSPLIYVYAWNFIVTAFDAALVVKFSRRGRTTSTVVPVGD